MFLFAKFMCDEDNAVAFFNAFFFCNYIGNRYDGRYGAGNTPTVFG